HMLFGVMPIRFAELERWLVLAVATYHGTVHSTLGQTPAGRWVESVAATSTPRACQLVCVSGVVTGRG
ncbi:hypothetical protein, partial [Mycobacterium tuberculosis]|uniref:hypothetical protein n=1 Tax=Mycobacterium tuberculosis TaxID=1773 RepID=UPI0011B86B76